MSKKAAAAATPATGGAALACGNAACGKAIAPPLTLMMMMLFIVLFLETNFVYLWGGYVLLQCSKCKAEAYCVPGGRLGRPRCAQPESAVRVCSLTRARSLPPCLHPPATRLSRGRPGTSTSAVRPCRARSSGAPRGVEREQMPRARRMG